MSLIEETIRVIPIIKIFGAQQYAINQFRKEKKLYVDTNVAVAKKIVYTCAYICILKCSSGFNYTCLWWPFDPFE